MALIAALFQSVQLKAADEKPLAVVSLAGIDSLMSDVDYLGQVLSNPQLNSQSIEGLLKAFSGGKGLDVFDRKKPWGVVVYAAADGGLDFKSYLFVPLKNEADLIKGVENYTDAPKDVGNGVKSIAIRNNPKEFFYKVQDGNMFVADTAEYLRNVPADPAALLGTMNKDYDLAARVHVQNLPEKLRTDMIEGLKKGVSEGLHQSPDEDDAAFAVRKGLMETQIKQLEMMLDELDDFTVGLNIDSAAKATNLDFAMTVKPGGKMAGKIASYGSLTSIFSGFFNPNVGAAGNVTSKLDSEDIQQTVALLDSLSDVAKKEIDKDEKLRDNAQAKEIVSDFFAVLSKTIQTGKFDNAGTVAFGDKTISGSFAGYVHDGTAAESLFKKVVDVIKENVTEVKMDVATHEGVKFNQVQVPVKEPKAKAIFGDTLDVHVGFGPKAFYVTFGKDGLTMCKEAITASATAGEKKVDEMLIETSLT
ncbi:MAG: hypothetical protein ABI644_10510, partial [Arenimonas sp.]